MMCENSKIHICIQHVSTSSQRQLLKPIQGRNLNKLIDHHFFFALSYKLMMQLEHLHRCSVCDSRQ